MKKVEMDKYICPFGETPDKYWRILVIFPGLLHNRVNNIFL